jgi:hypothetical protein
MRYTRKIDDNGYIHFAKIKNLIETNQEISFKKMICNYAGFSKIYSYILSTESRYMNEISNLYYYKKNESEYLFEKTKSHPIFKINLEICDKLNISNNDKSIEIITFSNKELNVNYFEIWKSKDYYSYVDDLFLRVREPSAQKGL